MGKIAKRLGAKARPKLLHIGRNVYRTRLVDSLKLARAGYAHLEGSAQLKVALAEVSREARELQELLRGMPEAERKRRAQELAKRDYDLGQRRLEVMRSTPQGAKALSERQNGYLKAAVTGMGLLLEDARGENGEPLPESGLLEYHEPANFLEDLRTEEEAEAGEPPYYIEPVQFVDTEDEADEDAGRIWLQTIPEDEREALVMAIQLLQMPAAEHLKPFRCGARGSADAGSAGEALPHGSLHGADMESVPDGAEHPVRGAGSGAGKRRSKKQ